MRKLIVSEFVTLDGVMEDPGGAEDFDRGGWAFKFERGPDGDAFKAEEVFGSDAMLLGRRTYEGFAAAWPERTDEAGFADRMNSMAKYVVSSTLEHADWNNSTVIGGDLAESVRALKDQDGGDILVAGSGQLVAGLIDLGQVSAVQDHGGAGPGQPGRHGRADAPGGAGDQHAAPGQVEG